MAEDWRGRLAKLLVEQNALVAKHLQPGLPEKALRRLLDRHGLKENIDPLIAVYTWRNGTRLTSELVEAKQGFVRGTPYHLLDLELALAHFEHAKAVASTHPPLTEGANRYFPLFWDGDTGWLATDLAPGRQNRMMLVEHKSVEPFREAYVSFLAFIEAALASLESNREMSGLREKRRPPS